MTFMSFRGGGELRVLPEGLWKGGGDRVVVSRTVPGDKGRELEGWLLWDPLPCSAPSLPQLGHRRGSCRRGWVPSHVQRWRSPHCPEPAGEPV